MAGPAAPGLLDVSAILDPVHLYPFLETLSLRFLVCLFSLLLIGHFSESVAGLFSA